MEIKWLGHACFAITHKGYTVVIDPYNSAYTTGYPPLKTTADKLLISHNHKGHNFSEAVTLTGKAEAECPFKISTVEVSHDTIRGFMRGSCKIHILEADGMRIVHMSDIGTHLNPEQIEQLKNPDVLMLTGGSLTGLPSQDVRRVYRELTPRVLIPMHYRFEGYGNRRLEHLDSFFVLLEKEDNIRYYDTDTLTITPETQTQIAALKFKP